MTRSTARRSDPPSSGAVERRFVFEDPSGRRWRRVRRVALGTVVLLIASLAAVADAVVTPAPGGSQGAAQSSGGAADGTAQPAGDGSAAVGSGIALGFDDPAVTGDSAIVAELGHLTHLAPLWYQLGAGGRLSAHPDGYLVSLAHAHGVQVLPVVQNFARGVAQPGALGGLAVAATRRAWVGTLTASVARAGADGVDVDLEGLSASLGPAFVSFVGELSAALHRSGRTVIVDVPVDAAAYDVGRLGGVADRVLLMAYDEHNAGTGPGPVASRPWVDAALTHLVAQVPAGRVILGLGGYAVDWGPEGVESLAYAAALGRADDASDIHWDAAASSPGFSYVGSDGDTHTVWLQDAASTQPLLIDARRARVAGVALWRAGEEDPAVWNLMGRGGDPTDIQAIGGVSGVPVTGPAAPGISTHPSLGEREIHTDARGDTVVGERYLDLPSFDAGLRRGTVALTFDDGPDPAWTPRILDILRRYHATATFFVVGREAAQQPGLLARMSADGDEIGNHTYTHAPTVEDDPDRVFGMELGVTQRIIQGATGHSATLFRFPYESLSVDDPQVARASSLGYQVVGWGTDTSDWQRPGVTAIVDAALDSPQGNVILMHDGGGDRSETVAALPVILDALQRRGLHAVSLGAAMGLSPAQAMPAARPADLLLGRVLLAATWVAGHALLCLQTAIALALLVVFCRLFVLGLLGPVHALRGRSRRGPYRGPVSVVIAAHNEQEVIARTLEAVLDSRYPGRLEVLVVDDGSTDATAVVVRTFAGPLARLLRQPQSGKSVALQRAFGRARHPVVVTLDADTLVTPTTVAELVAPLGDPRVAAVSGNIKVGNRVNWLTRLQGLEYTLTLNLERRAYALLDCVPIVPGAVGAWRRDAVLAAGGFTTDTLAEDTDMTLALRRAGHRIVYAPRALAFTEAPQTLRGLIRQRTRWSFGTLQCLWKHRRATFHPRAGTLGLVALPGMWLSQLLLPAVSPIVDLGVVLSPLTPWRDRILLAAAAYNLVLLALGAWALSIDREPLRRVLLIPVQNLVYRQFTYVMAMKAAIQALRGARVGWHRVVRLGTARTGEAPGAAASVLGGIPVPAGTGAGTAGGGRHGAGAARRVPAARGVTAAARRGSCQAASRPVGAER